MEQIVITVIENPQNIDLVKLDMIKSIKNKMLDLGIFVTVDIKKA